MRLVAITGTDIASLTFFDPASLPDDFDQRVKNKTPKLLDGLHSRGLIHEIEIGADGSYLIHLYLDEAPPAELDRFCLDPIDVPKLAIPHGELWVCGSEFVSSNPALAMKRCPHMGTRLELPPGNYALTLMRTEWEDDVEDVAAASLGPQKEQRYHLLSNLFTVGVLVALLATISLFFVPLTTWMKTGAPVATVMIIGAVMTKRAPVHREGLLALRRIEMERPSIVVCLRRLASSA